MQCNTTYQFIVGVAGKGWVKEREMREVLFRGKKVNGGEWVEGDLLREKDVFGIVNTRIYQIRGNDYFAKYEVNPETVCQYTGLTDKNGKKIFEGDVISSNKYGVDNGNGQNHSGKDKFVVGYADGTYFLENKLRRFFLRPDVDAELIGNIFDNPDFLTTSSTDSD